MAVEMKDIAKLYIALFGRAPEGDGLAYWYQQAADKNWDMAELAQAMYTAALQYEDYANLSDARTLVESIYENVLGKTYNDDPEGINYWVEQIENEKITPGEIASIIIKTAEEQYPEHPATKTLENRAEFALYVAQKFKKFDGNFTEFKKFIDVVNDDPASIELAKKMVDSYISAGVDYIFDSGSDVVQGSKFDDVFYAPLAQNELGQVVNTLESGDIIKGNEGEDVLKADVSYTVTGSNNAILTGSPAITPTIEGVEKLELTAQYIKTDIWVNGSNLDAGNISGVKEIWDVNSRTTIQIEDVRELPEELVFGMKDTDPVRENLNIDDPHNLDLLNPVDFRVYFDPEQVTQGRTLKSKSTLSIVLDDLNSDELDNFSINGVMFKLDGVQYHLKTEDSLSLGKTYEEFAQNLQNLIDQNPDLAGRLQVSYDGGNTIVITDTKGGEFEPIGFTWVDNIVPSNGALVWDMEVGLPQLEKAPVETTLILDNVGRTSQGGNVDIGSMGEGGIQVMDVKVDRDSWVSSISSNDYMGRGYQGQESHNILETVKLYSIGANGDLTVGYLVPSPDGRVIDGLVDVKEVLNEDFKGKLKYGVTLTDYSINKYLDNADDVVKFQYDGGANSDLITIEDASEHDSLSRDPFFSMDVNLGDGDDKLVLDMQNVNQVSVDGGEGNDTIAVSNSHGTTSKNTFKSFTNIQTYEVEAEDDTEHKFDSMPSVEHVIVDSPDSVNTTLIHLPVAADVTISGKWQTLDDTNGDQEFEKISIQAAKASADDRTLRVILENTARYDGKLIVDTLEITDYGLEKSQIDTLELVSTGKRQTSNIIDNLSAKDVDNFKVSGTQALNVDLVSAAHYYETNRADRHSLTFDASELTGDLTLQMNVAIPSRINENTEASVTITGGQSTNDKLILYNEGADITARTTVTGIETVQLGRDDNDIDGEVNVSKFTGVAEYDVYHTSPNDLVISGLSGAENIVVNIDWDDNAGTGMVQGKVQLESAEENSTNTVSVVLKDFDAINDDDINTNIEIAARDFAGINVDIVDNGSKMEMELQLKDVDGDDISKVVIKGGLSPDKAHVDKLTLEMDQIDNDSLKTLDVSGYDGFVNVDKIDTTAGDNNVTIYLNKWGGVIKEINDSDPTVEKVNVMYRLTSEMVKGETWIIDGFENGDGSGNQVDATDKSVIDVNSVGINYISDLKIVKLAHNDGGWQADAAGVTISGGDVQVDETALGIDVNHDGDVLDQVLLNGEVGMDLTTDQAIYLVQPNDPTEHSFNFLIGVIDKDVALDEDFFNGL